MKAMMTAACLATVCALAANAQTQGQGQQQGQTQQTAPQQRADAQQAVTLSGCLERDTMAAATTGTTGQQPTTAQAFKLTDVTILSGAEHIRRGTAGQTQQQREAEDKDKEFRLTASAGVNLTEHVGHEVEVVGRVVTSSPSVAATGATGATGTTGTTGQTQQQQQQQQRTTQREEDRDKAPLIMVNTVKMTATTCR
jgi:hypothetical protein